MTDESILCVKRKNLPKSWLKECLSQRLTWSEFIAIASKLEVEFRPRRICENDANFKQLIPYILLIDRHEKMAFYQRSGSEKRLNGCFSIGIGGHIRDDDFSNSVFSWAELQEKALQRELAEELPGFIPQAPPEFIGLINEEITRVGHSHLGLVYLIKSVDSANLVIGEELRTLEWTEPKNLMANGRRKFEIWSELALNIIFAPAR